MNGFTRLCQLVSDCFQSRLFLLVVFKPLVWSNHSQSPIFTPAQLARLVHTSGSPARRQRRCRRVRGSYNGFSRTADRRRCSSSSRIPGIPARGPYIGFSLSARGAAVAYVVHTVSRRRLSQPLHNEWFQKPMDASRPNAQNLNFYLFLSPRLSDFSLDFTWRL